MVPREKLPIVRDFGDVRGIVRGYRDLLQKGKPGEVCQLCSGHPVSIESILQMVISFASKPVQVSIDKSLIHEREAPEE